MSLKTLIQWCDSTVNPVMGCEGCELWPKVGQILNALLALVLRYSPLKRKDVRTKIAALVNRFETASELWHARAELIAEMAAAFPDTPYSKWHKAIKKLYRCYAGVQHLYRGARPKDWNTPKVRGFAPNFDIPKLFPGRMAEAAGWSDLSGTARPHAPWLDGLPRLIFVSDMGDALSDSVPFEFLKTEIIDNVSSAKGRRHVWLWLTKRPKRMAEFATWLLGEHGLKWPANLVAMTSVTNRATRSRIEELRSVPAQLRGLSVEPLVEQVDLDLVGIDWVIVGGESGDYAREFDLEWARSIQAQCKSAGVPFFLKQLGAYATDEGFPIPLRNGHGGDWNEWPGKLRVRAFPAVFRKLAFEPRARECD